MIQPRKSLRNGRFHGRLLGWRDALLSVMLGIVFVLGGCNARDNIGDIPDTSMHEAARNNDVEALELLKAQGADINARANDGETPMHYAALGDAVEAMKWLKAQGANINAQTQSGYTPMHYAAYKDAADAMKWLKAQGANINAREELDFTPWRSVPVGVGIPRLGL